MSERHDADSAHGMRPPSEPGQWKPARDDEWETTAERRPKERPDATPGKLGGTARVISSQ